MPHDLHADIEAVARIPAVPAILDVVCRTTGLGFAVVARVTPGRWIACAIHDSVGFGLRPGDELPVQSTFCHSIEQTRDPIVIDNATTDTIHVGHPAPALYGLGSYIAVPIVLADDSVFGTLCAADRMPTRLSGAETLAMFTLFAELIAFHLDANARVAASEASLLDAHETAAVREEFIAVLGHDLRNPLAAIDAGMRLLERTPLDAKAVRVVGMVKNSVARMSGLIDNVLDFARGRLGGGLSLDRDADEPLALVLDHIVDELQAAWPDREIVRAFDVVGPVTCDRRRIGQLFSNILANALTHGWADTPIRVAARIDAGTFELSVANAGEPIPPAALARLFQPFTRGAIKRNQQGLGLGLYIANQIARAHGGHIDVTSTAEETRFVLRMPLV